MILAAQLQQVCHVALHVVRLNIAIKFNIRYLTPSVTHTTGLLTHRDHLQSPMVEPSRDSKEALSLSWCPILVRLISGMNATKQAPINDPYKNIIVKIVIMIV